MQPDDYLLLAAWLLLSFGGLAVDCLWKRRRNRKRGEHEES